MPVFLPCFTTYATFLGGFPMFLNTQIQYTANKKWSVVIAAFADKEAPSAS
jgi:hypothetical protein